MATRYDDVRAVVRRAFALDLRTWGGPDERNWARLKVGRLGAIRAAVLSTAPVKAEARRTEKLIRQLDADAYKLDLLLSGDLVLAQDGREAVLRPGDFALCDLARPLRMSVSGTAPLHLLALVIPRALLPLPPREVARLTAVRTSGRQGVGSLVSSLLSRLVGHLDEYGPAEQARISSAMVDLLVAALAGRLDLPSSAAGDAHREALLQRIHGFIEEQLGDPELSPRLVAANCHVSLRYLHKLFQDQGVTVAGWIRRRRLEGCRRDLADPALAARPVSAIAARWGLDSAAHFSRTFRAEYGLPPSEYRQRAYLPTGDGRARQDREPARASRGGVARHGRPGRTPGERPAAHHPRRVGP